MHNNIIPEIDIDQIDYFFFIFPKFLRGVIFNELQKLYIKHACHEYLENWPELVRYCGYREDNIPQLEDVNTYLKRK